VGVYRERAEERTCQRVRSGQTARQRLMKGNRIRRSVAPLEGKPGRGEVMREVGVVDGAAGARWSNGDMAVAGAGGALS
jgi:hypothetical protein